MPKRKRHSLVRPDSRGVALLLALAAIATLIIIGSGYLTLMSVELRSANNRYHEKQVALLAHSAERLVAAGQLGASGEPLVLSLDGQRATVTVRLPAAGEPGPGRVESELALGPRTYRSSLEIRGGGTTGGQ